MRAAGVVVGDTLALLREAVTPGIRTSELDEIAEASIRAADATPSFLGYHDYPASICVSVNSEVVHGIPGPRELESGDIVSIDCGAIVDGWHADAAISVTVGQVSDAITELSSVTEQALYAGLRAARPGNTIGDIGHAVATYVRSQPHDYGIVVDYVGHGIGSSMHMAPNVPNVGKAGSGATLKVGMALAIEPMITLGSPEVDVLGDNWTVVTDDGLAAAHWEHTIILTKDGPYVTTASDQSILVG